MAQAVYHCEASSAQGFLQQLSVCYMRDNYWFYVAGLIREGKNPLEVDAAILERYDIAISKDARYWRKKQGSANLQYLRFGRVYLILATVGRHKFYDRELSIRDARQVPIPFAGHTVSYRGGHPSVRIAPLEYRNLKAYFQGIARTRSGRAIGRELKTLPYERYAPVKNQIYLIFRQVNRLRKGAGMDPVPESFVQGRRRVCRPFELLEGAGEGATLPAPAGEPPRLPPVSEPASRSVCGSARSEAPQSLEPLLGPFRTALRSGS